MQNCNENFEYSDCLDTDNLDWDDDFFSENLQQFSDVENVCDSTNLIKSLQSTNYRVRSQIQTGVSPSFQEESLRPKNISDLTSKTCTLNASFGERLLKEQKQMDILRKEIITSNSRKKSHEDSDSEDFYSPIKKRKKTKMHSVNIFSNSNKEFIKENFLKNRVKTCLENCKASSKEISQQETPKSQSDLMSVSSQETCGSKKMTTSSQESCGSKMTTSSQESCGSKMTTSSQEILTSENMITSSQENSTPSKMITSSPEVNESQNITLSQESCKSPKMITSSQESLGNQVMNISIQEDSSIKKTASQSNSETRIITIPHRNNSKFQQIFICEETKIPNTLNQSINSNKLKVRSQQSLVNDTVSSKILKTDSPDKNNFAEKLNPVNDYFYNKTCRRYNKAEKKIIWSIRKRELLVTKRENAVDIREKLLDAREADIIKREDILKARERRYLRCKINTKKWIQKLTNNSKQLRKKVSAFEDETNAFNKLVPSLKAFK